MDQISPNSFGFDSSYFWVSVSHCLSLARCLSLLILCGSLASSRDVGSQVGVGMLEYWDSSKIREIGPSSLSQWCNRASLILEILGPEDRSIIGRSA